MGLFCDNGIVGMVGEEISPQIAFGVGVAVAKHFGKMGTSNRIVVAKDTRTSSDMLFSALCGGICYAGVDVVDVGIGTSPAVSFLTKKYSASAGIMITGLNNGPQANGFVVFDSKGFKIAKHAQNQIEKALTKGNFDSCEFGHIFFEPKAKFDYLDFLKSATNFDLSGLVVRLDLCHGSACYFAEQAFENNLARVVCDNFLPDGELVNVACGPAETTRFCGAVTRSCADVGFVFSSDASQVIAIDEKGHVVDGDKILFLFASYLLENQRLLKNTIVGTKISSLSLELALKKQGIVFEREKGFEPSIVSKMTSLGLMLGGERCGKIVLRDFLPTSDGLLVALFVAKIMKEKGKKLSELVSSVKDLPCVQKSFIINKKQATKFLECKRSVNFFDRLRQFEKNAIINLQFDGKNEILVSVEAKSVCTASKIVCKIEKFVLEFAKENT